MFFRLVTNPYIRFECNEFGKRNKNKNSQLIVTNRRGCLRTSGEETHAAITYINCVSSVYETRQLDMPPMIMRRYLVADEASRIMITLTINVSRAISEW